jgi:hypothetical protein
MRRIALIFAVAMLTQSAVAQTNIQIGPPAGASPNDSPPVSISPGWRYQRAPNDVHAFFCEQDQCDRSSRVSYRLYAPDNSLTLEKFREQQKQAVQMLQERGPPGTRIAILGIEGSGEGIPRIFKSRRLVTNPDGSKEYVISSLIVGSRASATLISSSRDEKAVDKNHAQFGVAVMLFVAPEPKT